MGFRSLPYKIFLLLFALLIGKVIKDYSGSPGVKQVVKFNKRCQSLKLLRNSGYLNCQKELDKLVEKLLESGDLDISKCMTNPMDENSALCHLRVWFIKNSIEVKAPNVVLKVNGEDIIKQNKKCTAKTGTLERSLRSAMDFRMDEPLRPSLLKRGKRQVKPPPRFVGVPPPPENEPITSKIQIPLEVTYINLRDFA